MSTTKFEESEISSIRESGLKEPDVVVKDDNSNSGGGLYLIKRNGDGVEFHYY